MVNFRVVRVAMGQRQVAMRVRVTFLGVDAARMRVLMMFVMAMDVIVVEWVVLMVMIVGFGKV